MSKHVLSDTEAELLMKRLNRRMSAISVLTRGPREAPWSVILLQGLLWISIGVCWWIFWGEDPDVRILYPLLPVIMVLLWIMEIYNANLNKRVDALVELLQQEGTLHPELRPESAKEP
jgi:hypothetical protein